MKIDVDIKILQFVGIIENSLFYCPDSRMIKLVKQLEKLKKLTLFGFR